jgi:hypothetical protein
VKACVARRQGLIPRELSWRQVEQAHSIGRAAAVTGISERLRHIIPPLQIPQGTGADGIARHTRAVADAGAPATAVPDTIIANERLIPCADPVGEVVGNGVSVDLRGEPRFNPVPCVAQCQRIDGTTLIAKVHASAVGRQNANFPDQGNPVQDDATGAKAPY